MNEQLLLQIASSSLIAGIVGAYLGHSLTYRREKKSRLQQQRIEYLVDAYRAFAKANHHPRLYEMADELEQALADIQLFGSPKLIRLVQTFANELSARREASLDEVLMTIRESLRSELGEEVVSGSIICLKVQK